MIQVPVSIHKVFFRRTLRRSLYLARNGSDLLNNPSYPCLVSSKVRIKKSTASASRADFQIPRSRRKDLLLVLVLRYVRIPVPGSRRTESFSICSLTLYLAVWRGLNSSRSNSLSQTFSTLSEQWPHLTMERARCCCHLDTQHFVLFFNLHSAREMFG